MVEESGVRMTGKKQIGRILLRQRALSPEQLDHALAEKRSGRLASRLAEEGTISEVDALKALSEQHGIPGIDLDQLCLNLEDLDLLPREIAEKHLILPVLARDDRLFIAMANPREKKVIDELEFVTGKKVYPYVALEGALSRVIQSAYTRKARGEAFYVGPKCPAETLERHGVTPEGEIQPNRSLSPLGVPKADLHSERPISTPGVVVDDAVDRAANEDVEADGFGDLSRDLSVVTDLPELEEAEAGQRADAKSILVVDDEADIRRMLKRLLTGRGYRVYEAEKGQMALRMVKEHNPDLIVLDAMLPEVHGFDIARRIKGSKRYGQIPIIMVSAVYRGWRYAEDLKQSCGVDHFIEKPFKIAEVMSAVESSLASERPPVEAAEVVSGEVENALNAGVEAYKAGRLDEAMEHLRKGISIDPLAYRLHFHLGLLYGRTGQVFEAISELETAVEINSHHFPAVKNLAILYQKAGFKNKAVEMWQRGLTMAPDEETRQSIKQHLLSLL